MKLVKEHQGKDEKICKIIRIFNSNNAPIQLEKDELGCPNEELKLRNQVLVREINLTYNDLPQEQVSQVIIPKSLVENAIRIIHDDRAHPGRDETIRQARMKYYWKDMVKDINALLTYLLMAVLRGRRRHSLSLLDEMNDYVGSFRVVVVAHVVYEHLCDSVSQFWICTVSRMWGTPAGGRRQLELRFWHDAVASSYCGELCVPVPR